MTKEEFNTLKNELTSVVLTFEILQRRSYFLRNSYLLEFADVLEQEVFLQCENDYLIEAIKKKNDGVSKKELDNFLNNCHVDYSLKLNNFKTSINEAEQMSKRCAEYSLEDMENFDQEFADFCKANHPAIKVTTTKSDIDNFNMFASVYRMGNISGFHSLLKEYENNLNHSPIDVEQNLTTEEAYQKSLHNLKTLIAQLNNQFPLNKEYVLLSEQNVTKELAFLREKVYELKMINQNLHKDFMLNFEYDFNL